MTLWEVEDPFAVDDADYEDDDIYGDDDDEEEEIYVDYVRTTPCTYEVSIGADEEDPTDIARRTLSDRMIYGNREGTTFGTWLTCQVEPDAEIREVELRDNQRIMSVRGSFQLTVNEYEDRDESVAMYFRSEIARINGMVGTVSTYTIDNRHYQATVRVTLTQEDIDSGTTETFE